MNMTSAMKLWRRMMGPSKTCPQGYFALSSRSQSRTLVSWHGRRPRLSTARGHGLRRISSATVAGAGPAGLAVVGNLIQEGAHKDGPIIWVDPSFRGGKFGEAWREVPSNTKVELFLRYAEALKPFRHIISEAGEENAVQVLRSLDGESTCQLSYAADMVDFLVDGILKKYGDVVRKKVGTVTGGRVIWPEGGTDASEGPTWVVEVESRTGEVTTGAKTVLQTFKSERLILATGASPTRPIIPISGLNVQHVSLETALAPSLLAKAIPETGQRHVAVVGGSHSAVLVLMNLLQLARSSHPGLVVQWMIRGGTQRLKYAVQRDGYIERDNTGLKGSAADFAREHFSAPVADTRNRSERRQNKPIERVKCAADGIIRIISSQKKSAFDRLPPQCSHIIFATGFAPNPLPKLMHSTPYEDVRHDPSTGRFTHGKSASEQIPNLFGAGIAYPERVKDQAVPDLVEQNVGLWKFMLFLQRAVPDWMYPVELNGKRGGKAKKSQRGGKAKKR